MSKSSMMTLAIGASYEAVMFTQDGLREAHLGHSLQVELTEGSLEASLALCDVARYVVPVQLHVATHIGQVQDLLQAGSCFWFLLDERLHQLLQIIAVVPWNWRELPTAAWAARDFHFQGAIVLFVDLRCQQFISCMLIMTNVPQGKMMGTVQQVWLPVPCAYSNWGKSPPPSLQKNSRLHLCSHSPELGSKQHL